LIHLLFFFLLGIFKPYSSEFLNVYRIILFFIFLFLHLLSYKRVIALFLSTNVHHTFIFFPLVLLLFLKLLNGFLIFLYSVYYKIFFSLRELKFIIPLSFEVLFFQNLYFDLDYPIFIFYIQIFG